MENKTITVKGKKYKLILHPKDRKYECEDCAFYNYNCIPVKKIDCSGGVYKKVKVCKI
jgi:hypothetical protein